MADLNKIKSCFPYPSARTGQMELIEKAINAFDSGKRFVIIEAPVGAGKSAIGYTIGNYYDSYYYITAQKLLQSQLSKDFGENGKWINDDKHPMIELKGRNAYPCSYYEKKLELDKEIMLLAEKQHFEELVKLNIDCARGECKKKGKGKLKFCEDIATGRHFCPYFIQRDKAIENNAVLMNFHSFIFQTQVAPDNWAYKDLLIIDECLHPHTFIETDHGRISIGKLVNHKLPYKVLSFNKQTEKFEYKNIVRYLKRKKQQTYRIIVGNKVLYPTKDHKIYTKNGIKKLSNIKLGDYILTNEIEINKIQEQIVLGSLLGDANVQIVKPRQKPNIKNVKNQTARIKFVHGHKQKQYLNWKYQLLKNHVNTKPKKVNNDKAYGVTSRFTTRCSFNDLVNCTVINNKKKVNINWLNKINEIGLAVWYMDDGSINNHAILIYTEGFTFKENKIIQKWLKTKFNINANVKSYLKHGIVKYYYIKLSTIESLKFLKIVSKYIPDHMRYKLGSYNDVVPCYNHNIEDEQSKSFRYQQVTSIKPYKTTTTYDLEVEDNHNYIAGSTVVSNCHVAESVLMDFISLSFADTPFKIQFPKFETAEEYAIFFEENGIPDIIADNLRDAISSRNDEEEEYWKSITLKYVKFKSSVTNGEDWVVKYENKNTYRTIELKPLFVNKFANSILFNKSERILMMSGTILSAKIMAECLGINKEDYEFISIDSQFPVENRLIHYKPSGSMSYKNKRETMPKMMADIEKICKKHIHDRGIIHSQSFDLTDYVMKNSSSLLNNRLFFQKNFPNKEAMLVAHAASDNGIIIAPAMSEGLDLKDELSRFQILLKVPYPSFVENPQLEMRMRISSDYYNYLTAMKICQSVGRSIRSETDFASTYILDEDFKSFFARSKQILPKWFKESIVWQQ